MGQAGPVRGHEVLAGHGPQGAHPLEGALVPHDAHGLHGQQHGEGLARPGVPAALPEFLEEDGIGVLQDGGPLAGDGAGQAHGQTWSREGMPLVHLLGQAERQARGPHLVLEELPEGLHQLQLHAVRQAAHVVVGLHQDGAADAAALDHVRVRGALAQEVGLDLARLPLEDLDEPAADDLPLLLGIGDARQSAQELVGGVHPDHVQLEGREVGLHLLHLVLAHEAVVHEDAGQLGADGLVQQQGRHAGVHTAAEAQHHGALPHLVPDGLHLLVDEVPGVPVQDHAAALDEVQQEGRALGAVGDLRVELDGVEVPGGVLHGRHGHRGGPRRDREACGRLLDVVTVTHPHRLLVRQPAEQHGTLRPRLDLRLAVLAAGGAVQAAAQVARQQLLTVADAQDGHAQVQNGRVQVRRAGLQHRAGPAGQDHALQVGAADLGRRGPAAVDQAEGAQLPQPPGDEPGVLAAVVDDGDAFVVHGSPVESSSSTSWRALHPVCPIRRPGAGIRPRLAG